MELEESSSAVFSIKGHRASLFLLCSSPKENALFNRRGKARFEFHLMDSRLPEIKEL